jgi:WD40 repeat protein
LWRLDDGTLVQEFCGHESHVYNAAFHPHEPALVTGDLKANLIHWDLPTGKQVRQLKVESFHQYDQVFRADIGGFRGLRFSNEGSRLVGAGMINVTNAFAGVGNPGVVEIDWASGNQLIQHESKDQLKGVAWGLAIHPKPLTIAVNGGSSGGYLLFWNVDERQEHHSVKLPDTGRDLDLSGDGLHLATAHFDRHVRISRMAADS